jgi:hypothetical protein
MKNIILLIAATFAFSASAHLIEGTQILKGTLKTKIVVNTVKTTCKVKIKDVKNLMLEDSFGNPAYKVLVEYELDGSDLERSLSVKYDKAIWFNNLFTVGSGSEVRDLQYSAADGSKMLIDNGGRIKSVSFAYNGKTINCAF